MKKLKEVEALRILIIIPILNSNIGGMERFVVEFSTRVSQLGHNVTVITSGYGNHFKLNGVKVIRHKLYFPRYLNKLVKYLQLSLIAKRHLKKYKYDVVLAMGYSGVLLNNFVWRTSGSPVPLTKVHKNLHNNLFKRGLTNFDLLTQKILEKHCIRKAKFLMFPSVKLKLDFENLYDFKAKRYFIPCSGTGVLKEGKSPYNFDKLKGYFKILTVGGLGDVRKGRWVIVNALSQIDTSEIKLIVVGGINFKLDDELKRSIIDLGKIDLRSMPSVYKNCDLLIFPSLYEGFPNSILEAAHFGLPVISSKLEGIGEYFNKDEIMLIKKNDANDLALKITKIKNSKKLRKRLSNNIKKRAKELNYSLFVEEFVEFIISQKINKNLLIRNK